MGTGTAGLITSLNYHSLSKDLTESLEVAAGLITLQGQLDSLTAVVLQTRRGLDLLTAEKAGLCLYLKLPLEEMEIHCIPRMWKTPGMNYSENDKRRGRGNGMAPRRVFLCFLHLLRENQHSYLNSFQEITLGNIHV